MLPLRLGTLLLVLSAPSVLQEDEPLVRARKLLGETPEESCRKGAEICTREDSRLAVELLLDVLRLETDRGGYLPSAHYRDVVWGALREMTSGEARGRVQEELDKNKKDAWMRQWCAELLGEYGASSAAHGLADACGDKEIGVRRAAARALGKLLYDADAGPKSPRALATAALKRCIEDKDPILRANAIESLARLAPEENRELWRKGLQDKDAGVRCALLGAVRAVDENALEELAAVALGDPDWRPRMEAVDLLGSETVPTALPLLIRALGDARPAVAARSLGHLQTITGEKLTRKDAWEAWWKEKGESFEPGKGRKKEPVPDEERSSAATFNGITIESDHAAFLIDVSKDMKDALTSQKCSKAEAAQRELDETFSRLQGKLVFSLFAYAREVTPFAKKPVDLDAKTQAKAIDFVRDQRPGDAKDIWQALENVLADPTIDTVFLLSSGEPEVGRYVHWNRTTWQLRELNRFRKLVVHAIAYSDSKWYREQLEKIAEATGGEFRWFE